MAVQCWVCLSENEVHDADPHQNFLVREIQTVHLFRALAKEVENAQRADLNIISELMALCFQVLLRDFLAECYVQTSLAQTNEKPGGKSAIICICRLRRKWRPRICFFRSRNFAAHQAGNRKNHRGNPDRILSGQRENTAARIRMGGFDYRRIGRLQISGALQ